MEIKNVLYVFIGVLIIGGLSFGTYYLITEDEKNFAASNNNLNNNETSETDNGEDNEELDDSEKEENEDDKKTTSSSSNSNKKNNVTTNKNNNQNGNKTESTSKEDENISSENVIDVTISGGNPISGDGTENENNNNNNGTGNDNNDNDDNNDNNNNGTGTTNPDTGNDSDSNQDENDNNNNNNDTTPPDVEKVVYSIFVSTSEDINVTQIDETTIKADGEITKDENNLIIYNFMFKASEKFATDITDNAYVKLILDGDEFELDTNKILYYDANGIPYFSFGSNISKKIATNGSVQLKVYWGTGKEITYNYIFNLTVI